MNDLKTTVIQSDLYWEQPDANLAMFEEKIWKIDQPTDVIVLPEMFSTGFTMNVKNMAEPMHSRTYRWMAQMARQTKAVVMGSYIVQDGAAYYNRFMAVRPDGSYEKYDKRHLFGLAGEDKDLSPGTGRSIIEVKGWKILPLICYDLRFPVWSRSVRMDQQLYEYEVVMYVASWPKPRIHSWDTLLKARAVENIAYSIGVNRIGQDANGYEYVGHSAVYDFLGQPLTELHEEAGMATTTLSWDMLQTFRDRFPFQADADRFSLD
ncbi:MAG: amidohydrolase [Cyclobacteriaceae bacterium]|nr:amidohydrolase [Cyclobacteriaceae bacterium]